jgi:hypothetical protein
MEEKMAQRETNSIKAGKDDNTNQKPREQVYDKPPDSSTMLQ